MNGKSYGFSRLMQLGIGGKLILIFFSMAVMITVVLSVVSYSFSSSAIETEATGKLSSVAELKTSIIENFISDRYGDVHVMTGIDVLKKASEGLIRDINNSKIDPSLSIERKRKILRTLSENYIVMEQYIDKYMHALPNFNEIKFVAVFDITNRNGRTVFREGDQILSANSFTGNVQKRSMYKGGHDLMVNKGSGVHTEKYSCPFLYSSSIEYCFELKKPSIHLSHGLPKNGISMSDLKRNTSLKRRFSTMMIFDVKTETINALLQDSTGMGNTGESYMVQRIDGKNIMLSESRFEKGTSLKKDLSSVKGLQEHIDRNEHRRGKGFCTNKIYEDYRGERVLAHNHMIKIGKNDVAVVTEIDESEVFEATFELLMIMLILGVAVLFSSVFGGIIFSRTISKPLKYGVDFAETIASGDLTQEMDKKYLNRHDEIGDLAKALEKMTRDLEDIISNVMISAQNLTQAVGQIASGNQDLSQRTSEQASSLEEVASSIEEATSSINQNADNADESSKLSNRTSELAEDGGKVLGEAIQAITEISESSKKMGEIVSVINEIAFQTNLLALNAAVEAARAGEHGRGFAVVAAEVRNLAQRAGTSSKEIEQLISESVEKIEMGTELSGKSGDSLKEIIEAVKNVNNVISEISAASLEQKQGMGQINTAITQMDAVTQENASLVEETASASEEMSNQAQELLGLVEKFKIREDRTADKGRKKIQVHYNRAKEEKKSKPENTKSVKADSSPVSEKKSDMSEIMKEDGFDEF